VGVRDHSRASQLGEGRSSALPVFHWLGISPALPPAPADEQRSSEQAPPRPEPSTAQRASRPVPRLACRLFGHRIDDPIVDGYRLRGYAPGGILRCARCGQANRRWQGWR
jgi:hypothetical protein